MGFQVNLQIALDRKSFPALVAFEGFLLCVYPLVLLYLYPEPKDLVAVGAGEPLPLVRVGVLLGLVEQQRV